ncbi:MAG: alpha/beta fold hydrolase [Flavobacteriales bacterium]
MDLYLLPGLGADGRLFDRLSIGDHRLHRLDWPAMPAGSTLRDYALVLARRVDASRPHALVGVSMGGMVGQEMAALTHPARTIIISSWKGPHEMPMPISLLRRTQPERLITAAFIKRTLPFIRWQMGLETPDDHALFDAFLGAITVEQIRVQIAAVLGWEGPAEPVPDLVHIHGGHDRLMPLHLISNAKVIEDGGHFMVYNRALKVSLSIKEAISSKD